MFNPGAIVSMPYFPNQEDRTSGTARIALIVEDLGDKYLVIPGTCSILQKNRYIKTKIIDKDSAIGKKMGLTCITLFILDRAAEFPKFIFEKPKAMEIKGYCTDEVLDEFIKELNHKII